jgi:hypothetical protein
MRRLPKRSFLSVCYGMSYADYHAAQTDALSRVVVAKQDGASAPSFGTELLRRQLDGLYDLTSALMSTLAGIVSREVSDKGPLVQQALDAFTAAVRGAFAQAGIAVPMAKQLIPPTLEASLLRTLRRSRPAIRWVRGRRCWRRPCRRWAWRRRRLGALLGEDMRSSALLGASSADPAAPPRCCDTTIPRHRVVDAVAHGDGIPGWCCRPYALPCPPPPQMWRRRHDLAAPLPSIPPCSALRP